MLLMYVCLFMDVMMVFSNRIIQFDRLRKYNSSNISLIRFGCEALFHVLLYNRDSMLNGFDRMLIFGASLSPLLSRPSVLSRRVIEQSSGSSSSESSPTTSICISSSSRSDSLLIRCCAKYSAFNVSISTVMPFARSLRACRSNALANFFRRRALEKRINEKKTRLYICKANMDILGSKIF